jgi:hypothetical protein
VTRWHACAAKHPDAPASIAVLEHQGAGVPGDDRDALARLLDARAHIPRDGVTKLALHSDPANLLESLAARGIDVSATEDGHGGWALELPGPDAQPPLDLRDLEALEPLQRILEACASIAPGASLLARTPRFPRMLMPQLERRSLYWEAFEEPDETALVYVRRPD